jgi:epoxyqueuosine reductase
MTVFSKSTCSKEQLTRIIKDKALELGYADVGICPADAFEGYRDEVESRPGYEWMLANPAGPYNNADPHKVMPEAKSVIALVDDFSKTEYPEKLTPHFGRAYLGRRYVPKKDLINGVRRQMMVDFLADLGIAVDDRGSVQIPDRLAGATAGVITYGGNNFAYAKGCGSFIIVVTLLVDVELDYDEPTVKRPCPPDCHRCVDACPTGALYEKGKLNPTRCKLYFQIRPAEIPEDLREQMGVSIHGCDLCQEACPRNKPILENRSGHAAPDPFLERLADEFDLEKVLELDEGYYERFIYPIAYNYIGRDELWMFQRNAAIALGNTLDPAHLPALRRAKWSCPDEVLPYIDWAIERIEDAHADEK